MKNRLNLDKLPRIEWAKRGSRTLYLLREPVLARHPAGFPCLCEWLEVDGDRSSLFDSFPAHWVEEVENA